MLLQRERAFVLGEIMSATRHQPPDLALGLLLAVVAVVVQVLLLPLFAAPAANIAPRDLPLVMAGPQAAATEAAERLASARPGAFKVTVLTDSAAADRALTERSAYGAIVLGPQGPALHVASAASPTVAALLGQAVSGLAPGQPMPVTDVVPTDPDDPRGAGFASGFLPLAIASLFAAILLTIRARSRGSRLVGLLTFGVLAGVAGAAVLQLWLGILPGTFLLNAAAIGLISLAIAAGMAGLGALLGPAGLGLGVLVVFLVGNALSGVGSAPELLPQPWGEVGQYLPIGAGGTLLRSVVYFEGEGGAMAAWVLGAYALIGLAFVALRRPAGPPAAAPAAPAATRPTAALG
jgi:hypothetical protein